MPAIDLIIKNGLVYRNGSLIFGDLFIQSGKIASFEERSGEDALLQPENCKTILDAKGHLVLPGVIDAHTHFDLPLFGEGTADTFTSGSLAAACGGVTTFIDFTDPKPGELLADSINRRKQQAENNCYIDYSFHATVYRLPEDIESQLEQVRAAGITSLKVFTTYRKEGRMLSYTELLRLCDSAKKSRFRIGIHAEDNEIIEKQLNNCAKKGHLTVQHFPESRPMQAEIKAIEKILEIAQQSGCSFHLFHITTAEAMKMLSLARKHQMDVTYETCPQYLFLDDQVFQKTTGFLYTCCPPIRPQTNRNQLWELLKAGRIFIISTDHCAFSRVQKRSGIEDFRKFPFGLPGVETSFPLLFTHGYQKGFLTIEDLVMLFSEQPAKAFGLYPQKGSLETESDADIIIVDPDAPRKVNPATLHTPIDWNPFEGASLYGFPRITIVRGKIIQQNGIPSTEKYWGKFLTRSPVTSE